MSAGTAIRPVLPLTHDRVSQVSSRASLKRKIDSSLLIIRKDEFDYPSPPMSNPSSPPQTAQGSLTRTTSEVASFIPASAATPTLGFTIQPSAPPSVQAGAQLPLPPPGQLFPVPPVTLYGAPYSPFGALETGQGLQATSSVALASTAARSSIPRSARKSKSHVASACINCKRAHLSCDVSRPCARCVASGKQDTCLDVQHKKRGRPRLRDAGEFKVEQMLPVQASQAAVPVGAAPIGRRPIAATRHGRTDSLRSLRSQTSDGSSGPTIATPGFPPPAFQSTFSPQQPLPPNVDLSPDQIPTAYVDLDFVLIRANRPFLQILSSGHDVRGRSLNEVVTSADNESLLAIRNRLRGEREAREPAYMPPILPMGQDLLQGILEADVDRLSQGFSDHTYTWMRAQFGSFAETFPARVRLAKAVSYFVVITLPSFRPVAQPAPSASAFVVPPPPAVLEGYPVRRQLIAQPAPPASLYHNPNTGRQSPQQHLFPETQPYRPPLLGTQTQPPYGYSPHMQQHPPTTPRLPTAEPPTDTTPFTPRSATREAAQAAGTAMLLPPIPNMPFASSGGGPEPSPPRGSSEEEGEGGENVRSPKKRRRMGISDVLQR